MPVLPMSRNFVPLCKPKPRLRVHSLFVGIDTYLDGFNPLEGCANDASALCEAFKLFSGGTSKLLINKQATRHEILTQLEAILRKALDNDLVVFYYASHGMIQFNDFYLLPSDADSNCLLASGFPFSVVSNALSCFSGIKSLFIMDACQSGAIGFNVSRYRVGSESSIMVAAQPSEASEEFVFEGMVHGAFTFSLVKAIKDWADLPSIQPLTLMNLFDEAYQATKDLTDDRQHPVLIGTLDTKMVLAERVAQRPLKAEPELPQPA